ncbi:unnamed protein product, partial [Ectocarpus sp. 8 AP-2014]
DLVGRVPRKPSAALSAAAERAGDRGATLRIYVEDFPGEGRYPRASPLVGRRCRGERKRLHNRFYWPPRLQCDPPLWCDERRRYGCRRRQQYGRVGDKEGQVG